MRTCLRKIGILAATILFAVLCTVGCNTGTSSSDPAPETFTVQMTAGEHGTLTANPAISENGKAAQGTVITFTAVPESGYRVEKWTVTPKSALIAEGKAGNTLAKVKITANTKVNVSFTNDLYTVTLKSVDPAKKGAVIKAVSEITGSTLEDATTLVEGVPKVLKENITEAEADEIIAKITEAGGTASRPERYTVSLTPVEHGTVTANPVIPASGKVDKDTEITFTAASAEGYKVGTWTITPSPALQEGGTAGSPTAKVKITAATTVNVSFTAEEYPVTFGTPANGTLKAEVGGTVIVSGNPVEYGKTVTFTATPASGYKVDTWTITPASALQEGGTAGSPTAKVKITANTQVNVSFTEAFTVVITPVEHGTLTANPVISPSGKVAKDTEITFTAKPDSGYGVNTWTITPSSALQEGGTKGSPTAKVKITADTQVNVSFTEAFTVEMTHGANGTLSADPAIPPNGKVAKDTEITFWAVGNLDYSADKWTITGGVLQEGGKDGDFFAKVKITTDTKVNVSFKRMFTVSVRKIGPGIVFANHDIGIVNYSIKVAKDTEITFTAKPDSGFGVDTWTITPSTALQEGGTPGSLTAKVKITADTRVKVEFVEKGHPVTFSVEGTPPNGTLKAEVDGTEITSGDLVKFYKIITFTAEPATDYAVHKWTITPSYALQEGGTAESLTAKVKITDGLKVNVSFTDAFTVEMTAGEHGTVRAAPVIPPNGKVAKDTEIIFVAGTDDYYKVDKWTITGGVLQKGGKDGDFFAKVKITTDTKVNVSFTRKKSPVTFNATPPNGTFKAEVDGTEITSGDTVEHGKSVTFTAVPASGYKVGTWTITPSSALQEGGTKGSLTAKVKISYDTKVNVSFRPLYEPVAFGANGTGLDTYLKTAAPHTDGIYYIEVTELTAGYLRGKDDWPHAPSALGKILKDNPTKKIALKLDKIPGHADMRYCFYNCDSLTQAPVLPNSVTNMQSCFEYCTSLTQAPVLPNSVTNMQSCFEHCTSLTQAPVLPNSVTNMQRCFSSCDSLTQAPVIPNSVTNMQSCFSSCDSLTQAPAIPNGVTDMQSCFAWCKNLTQAPVIPSSVTNMQSCFARCDSLTQAPVIQSGVTNMQSCFYECGHLTQAPVIPNSVTNMQSCFASCTSLSQAPAIPNSVTNMQSCFMYCTSLTQAPVIPSSVTNMQSCFEGCSVLTTVTLKCNYNPAIIGGKYAFHDAFTDCTVDTIKVPAGQLQIYKDNAQIMGKVGYHFKAE